MSESAPQVDAYEQYYIEAERISAEHGQSLALITENHQQALAEWTKEQPADAAAFESILESTHWEWDRRLNIVSGEVEACLARTIDIEYALPVDAQAILKRIRGRFEATGGYDPDVDSMDDLKQGSAAAHMTDAKWEHVNAALDGIRWRGIKEAITKYGGAVGMPKLAERNIQAVSHPTVSNILRLALDQFTWFNLRERIAYTDMDSPAICRQLWHETSSPQVLQAMRAALDRVVWRQLQPLTLAKGLAAGGVEQLVRTASSVEARTAITTLLTSPARLQLMYSVHGNHTEAVSPREVYPWHTYEEYAASMIEYFDTQKNPRLLRPLYDQLGMYETQPEHETDES